MNTVVRAIVTLVIAIPLLTVGCEPSTVFNPNFLADQGLYGDQIDQRIFPVDFDAIMVRLNNFTEHEVNYLLTWRAVAGDVNPANKELRVFDPIDPGENLDIYLPCPVAVITVGDIDNPANPCDPRNSFDCLVPTLVLNDGVSEYPLPPLGYLLIEGRDFQCFDILTFSVQKQSGSDRQYITTASISRATQ